MTAQIKWYIAFDVSIGDPTFLRIINTNTITFFRIDRGPFNSLEETFAVLRDRRFYDEETCNRVIREATEKYI